ncbi:hypothetical protein BDR04DRAFT_1087895 [Suillus decipiens]|nr:hypothetical protein BDR04DRAFT_1087895 [Suillus decipiens]
MLQLDYQLCAPPRILGTATSSFETRHSDATGDSLWHIAGPLLVSAVMFITAMSPVVHI